MTSLPSGNGSTVRNRNKNVSIQLFPHIRKQSHANIHVPQNKPWSASDPIHTVSAVTLHCVRLYHACNGETSVTLPGGHHSGGLKFCRTNLWLSSCKMMLNWSIFSDGRLANMFSSSGGGVGFCSVTENHQTISGQKCKEVPTCNYRNPPKEEWQVMSHYFTTHTGWITVRWWGMGHNIKLSFVPNTATSKQTFLITNQILGHIWKYICNCSNDRFVSSKWKVISGGCCFVVQ